MAETAYPMVPYQPSRLAADEALERGRSLYAEMDERRSVRSFSDDPVPRELIEYAIRCASTAPSGAHKQPWTFVVTGDPEVKRRIRLAAEDEERENYEGGRIPDHWREDLAPLGTDADKSYLETVPWIVVVFEQRYGYGEHGERKHHYYVKESVGIACGMFIQGLHHMGLSTLTHTPSPMAFLRTLLDRPRNERPFVLFPVGYPTDDCTVPDLSRKPLSDVMVEMTADDLTV